MFKKITDVLYEASKMIVIAAFSCLIADECINEGIEDLLFESSYSLNGLFIGIWGIMLFGAAVRTVAAIHAACTHKENEG